MLQYRDKTVSVGAGGYTLYEVSFECSFSGEQYPRPAFVGAAAAAQKYDDEENSAKLHHRRAAQVSESEG